MISPDRTIQRTPRLNRRRVASTSMRFSAGAKRFRGGLAMTLALDTLPAAFGGLIITGTGVAAVILTVRGLRSDGYVQSVIESAAKAQRRPVTPGLLRRLSPWVRALLVLGVAVGVAATVLGVLTLVVALS